MSMRATPPFDLKTERKRPYKRVQLEFNLPTRTRGSETPSTDLNILVAKYRQIGALPPSTLQYGDVSELPKDRLEAMELMREAAAAFSALPQKVRQACDHDPRKLENWIMHNPELARQYGLLSQKPPQNPSSPENPSSSGTDEGKKERKEPKSAPEAGERA